MRSTDQMGVVHTFDNLPRRVVSLVPSITELLCDLGLENQLVGCTKFCVHPSTLNKTTKVTGGTKKVRIEDVRSLDPDIIIGNKEENTRSDIEELNKSHPVWMSDVKNIEDTIELTISLGQIFQKSKAAHLIADKIKRITASVPHQIGRVVYLIWQNPYMTVGGDTFINDVLRHTGLSNVFGNSERYPVVTIDEIKFKDPDYILLSSEPFPFKELHISEMAEHFPNTSLLLVDGEYFSWYGTRMLHLENYKETLVNRLDQITRSIE